MDNIKRDMVSNMFRASIVSTRPPEPRSSAVRLIHDEASAMAGAMMERAMAVGASASSGRRGAQPQAPAPATVRRTAEKVGRNDPCPCGSGKKYKKCCGA